MSNRVETVILLIAVALLGLSNCATLAVVFHAQSERDRMAEETAHCYEGFNAVYSRCRGGGACPDLDRWQPSR